MEMKTYIKMCDCPEIQEQWKLKKGDCFSFVGEIHILADYEIDALNKRKTDTDCYNEVVKSMGGHFVDHWNECRDGFTWLPRQEQIQEMMYEIGQLGRVGNRVNVFYVDGPHVIVHDLARFIETKYYRDCLTNFNSMDQLWLAFYMHEKHGLVWSSVEGVWKKK